jgi:F-type H+-transporting ATPase subunit delta
LSSQIVARRYASALADAVLTDGQHRAIQDELIAWEAMIKSSETLQEVLSNPTIAYEQKRAVLEDLITRTKVKGTTANFLRILLRNQRLTDLAEINKRFAHVLDERSGVVAAHVTTARPVSQNLKEDLSKRLRTMTGKDVRLTFGTDEDLLGGMVTRVGSIVYDGSIRNHLRRLESKLAGK